MTNHIQVVDRPSTPEEGRRRLEKAKELEGKPFERLPGDLAPNSRVGECSDGTRISVEAVQMVWNDQILIDHVMGKGAYRKQYERETGPRSIRQLEILDLAEKLYVKGRQSGN